MSTSSMSLPNDILWSIFQHTNELFIIPNSRPLRELRNASQVCRAWRSLILNASSLWGHAIDVNDLLQYADSDNLEHKMEWRDDSEDTQMTWPREVIKRTQNSLLWVLCDCRDTGTSTWDARLSFTLYLVGKEWDRVQKLQITMLSWKPMFASEMGVLMHRPAPQLQVFDVDLNLMTQKVIVPSHLLFGGHAPCLTDLAIPFFSIDSKCSWVSGIQSLLFDPPHNLSGLMEVLKRTKNLRSLFIREPYHTDEALQDESHPPVQLHSLSTMSVHTGSLKSRFWAYLLPLINPSPACSLNLRLTVITLRDLQEYGMAPIITSAVNHLRQHSPSAIKFVLSRYQCELLFLPLENGPFFKLTFRIRFRDHHNILPLILNELTVADFSNVTRLIFHPSVPFPQEHLKLFIPQFTGVEILETYEAGIANFLSTYHKLYIEEQMILPRLQIIKIWMSSHWTTFSVADMKHPDFLTSKLGFLSSSDEA